MKKLINKIVSSLGDAVPLHWPLPAPILTTPDQDTERSELISSLNILTNLHLRGEISSIEAAEQLTIWCEAFESDESSQWLIESQRVALILPR